jgi:Tol biopolymer transport system component
VTRRARAAAAAIAIALACAAGCSDSPTEPNVPFIFANDFFPAWSPVADSVAFIRAQATLEGPAGIYIVGSDGGTPRLIAAGEFHDLRFSPDGSHLVTASHGNLLTVLVSHDNRALVLTSTLGVEYPDWSPDGNRIVYSRGVPTPSLPADSAGLHIVDLTTGADSTVRDSLGALIVATQPAWSPRDSLIAFNRGGRIEVWNARTRAVRRLYTAPAGYSAAAPAWIEGGQRLLAVEGGASFRTIVIDPATGSAGTWPLYLGGLRAIAPNDTAFVFRGLDSTITSPLTYVLYRRGLTDVAGTTIRQLTHHLP